MSPRILFLYGAPKVGKTTKLAELDNNLILDTEEGTRAIDAVKVNITSLKDLAVYGEEILKQGRPYKYISIDVIDAIEDWAEEEATKIYKASTIGANFTGDSVLDLPQGAGYRWLRDSFFRITRYISTLADRVIVIGHLRDKSITISGKEVDAKDINLTGKIKTIMASKSDAIGYVFRDKEGVLMVTFEAKDEVTCGARHPHLAGKTIPLEWDSIYID